MIDAVHNLPDDDADAFYFPSHKNTSTNDKFMLDLKGVVRHRFTMLGVRDENIGIIGQCTMCHPEKYYSHRGTNGNRGSLASVICL